MNWLETTLAIVCHPLFWIGWVSGVVGAFLSVKHREF